MVVPIGLKGAEVGHAGRGPLVCAPVAPEDLAVGRNLEGRCSNLDAVLGRGREGRSDVEVVSSFSQVGTARSPPTADASTYSAGALQDIISALMSARPGYPME